MIKLEYAALTDQGTTRRNNEDAWTVNTDLGVYIVADGMGGEYAGELASRIVVEVLPKCLEEALRDIPDLADPEAKAFTLTALADLSSHLRHETEHQPGLDGMGSTVVLAIIRNDKCLLAHMGDSRIYLLRDDDLHQVTKDHSIVQMLVDTHKITQAEAKNHPARAKVTRCVGMRGKPTPDSRLLPLHVGDTLLLCTDGLTDQVDDEDIKAILSKDASLDDKCSELVKAANDAGGRDNVTVMLIRAESDLENDQ